MQRGGRSPGPWTCLAALLVASTAVAQQNALVQTGSIPNLNGLTDVDDDDRMVQPWNISVVRAEDMDLYSPAAQKIAGVEEMLQDPSGRITALVVQIDVPGADDREVVVGVDQVNLQGERLTTGLTADQLRTCEIGSSSAKAPKLRRFRHGRQYRQPLVASGTANAAEAAMTSCSPVLFNPRNP